MTLIVRTLALALVVTGAVASTHIANAAQPSIGAKVSAMPVAGCDPNDANGCGICNLRKCGARN